MTDPQGELFQMERAPDWLSIAEEEIDRLCRTREHFTMDDVWDALDNRKAFVRGPHRMGALLRHTFADRCHALPQWLESRRAPGNPVRVWQSDVYSAD